MCLKRLWSRQALYKPRMVIASDRVVFAWVHGNTKQHRAFQGRGCLYVASSKIVPSRWSSHDQIMSHDKVECLLPANGTLDSTIHPLFHRWIKRISYRETMGNYGVQWFLPPIQWFHPMLRLPSTHGAPCWPFDEAPEGTSKVERLK